MIEDLAVRPADPLLKIIKMFREDPRRDKIDLGVGVYRDEHGATPVMKAVKEAERRLLNEQPTKTYVGQQGDVEFLRLLGELAFGEQASELVSIQAVGGTGALRLGCDLLKSAGAKRVLLPTPSWPNHPAIIRAAHLEELDIPFFDIARQEIDIDGLIAGFSKAEPGDAVILQGCCHNPLGADFSLPQWEKLADAVVKHGIVPFLDLAYQGFGDGLERDVEGVRLLMSRVPDAIIAVSGAKNFGVYRERVGALYVKAPAASRAAVQSNLFAIARANYSMPPDHGAACVRVVLSDPQLRALWSDELDQIRGHMQKTRATLAAARINSIPMHLIGGQKGMFSTLPLSEPQIVRLREEFGVYMTDAGRINVAGLPANETERFLAALRLVTS
jgi:aromatic-amino-acid transaminase